MSKTALDFISAKGSAGSKYKPGSKISFAHFVEDFIHGKIDVNGSFEEFMELRNTAFDYTLTADHFKFLLTRFLPEVLIHSKSQDERIVREHYDRGNDFFSAFLGPRMIYTSGFFVDHKNDTLEDAQDRKMQMVCEKLLMKPGNRHLDIGCGWGTLVTYAAKHYGTDSTGVTIAQDGTDFGNKQIADHGVTDRARILRMDYRDIPAQKFSHITCLEMGEHVGIRKFGRFIKQIYGLLEDDGTFYLQQAGLRANPGILHKGPHWEDLIWGLFMNKYIFSGADASTPLAFLVKSLQNANFEVQSVENLGIHYSHTIYRWYQNWMSNEETILKTYGVFWFRLWQVFLYWSVIIARQGNSTCWSIIAHKNLNSLDRNRYIEKINLGERMDMTKVQTY
jgi:cyclopropane fatty-acyl-phospholipid synthase-like methyltransferase